MTRRLTPPNPVAHPAPVTGPMPNRDAQDPPVDQIALNLAREIDEALRSPVRRHPANRVTTIQLGVIRAIDQALDRCQALGGRRVK